MRFRSLIIEAHRRSLWQVLAIYILGAWAAYEMIDAVTDRLGLPEWVPGIAIVLFLVGLPIVIATAFVQEGLPGQATTGVGDGERAAAGPADPTLVPGLERADVIAERPTAVSPLLTPAIPHPFLTWQRSVLAGIVAFLLLGLTAGGYLGLRNAGVGPFASLISSGAMSSQDRIVIAQLDHASGDSTTAAAITEALRVDLAQSRVLTVLETQSIGDALQRMGRDRAAHLDATLAREVAIREGAKAVLVGDIAPVGTSWVITVRLLHATTGEQLYSRRESANSAEEMIAAVDRMSKKLREAVGESLRTVRADGPLEAVTTSSLVALRKYTQGIQVLDASRDYDSAVRLLEEAVAEDSTFAMAWRKLATVHGNVGGNPSQMLHAATRAYELRNRLTERERYHTTAYYHLNVTKDTRAAINAYLSLLDSYPNDAAALNNIAIAYSDFREEELAAEYYRRAIAADSFVSSAWTNLVITEFGLGNRDEALALIDQIAIRFPEQREHIGFRVLVAAADGRYEEAEQQARDMLAASRGSNVWLARSHYLFASLFLMNGRGSDARQSLALSSSANRARGIRTADIAHEQAIASIDVVVYGQQRQAAQRLAAVLTRADWRDATLADREQLLVALEYARAGDPITARRLAAEWDAAPHQGRRDASWQRDAVDGWIALSEDRAADAIAAFHRAAAWGPCVICGLPALATAFNAAGMADSAITYHRRYIDTPDIFRLDSDALDLPIAYERLAELYEARGDIANARQYASLFVELWKNADPELQPRVRRKQEMLQRLVER